MKSAGQRGEVWNHLSGDRTFDSAAFGIPSADQSGTRLVELVSPDAELGYLGRELCGEPGVAERHCGLVGKVIEQPLVSGAQVMSVRHVYGDASQQLAMVDHRPRGARGWYRIRSVRWPDSHPVRSGMRM